MTEESFNIIGLGEVLWDCLPNGKQLGGAPANFAYISKQLGNNGIILSRIGNDHFGLEMFTQLKSKNLSVDHIQTDRDHRTGTVNVTLEHGQPSYEIVANTAWDFLELTDNWIDLAPKADAVCFGSLAQRSQVSGNTIRKFVGLTEGVRIFDVNLRQNYYSVEVLRMSLDLANVVKLNHEELSTVVEIFRIKGVNEIEQATNLRERFDLKMVCITRGGQGSLLITKNEVSESQGLKIKVADTIGAGDSYTAGMTYGILRGWNLDKINEFANKVGAFVASRTGAMPDFKGFEL